MKKYLVAYVGALMILSSCGDGSEMGPKDNIRIVVSTDGKIGGQWSLNGVASPKYTNFYKSDVSFQVAQNASIHILVLSDESSYLEMSAYRNDVVCGKIEVASNVVQFTRAGNLDCNK